MRLSRLVPLSESDLDRAREATLQSATRVARERIAPAQPLEASTIAEPVPSPPPPPLAPAPVPPAAAPSARDAQSEPRPTSPSDSVQPRDDEAPGGKSAPHSNDVDALLANLEEIAASLGIDPADIDENEPLPPEFLALFPPEIAAFLAPDPLSGSP